MFYSGKKTVVTRSSFLVCFQFVTTLLLGISIAQSVSASNLKIVETGIRDASNGKMVLDIRKPNRIDIAYGFTEIRKTTERAYGSGEELSYKIEYYRNNKPSFTLEITNINGMFSSNLEVTDNEISYENDITPGTNLSKHPTYNWKRKCDQKEGIYECSTSSDKIVYILDDGYRQFKNIREAVSKSPVKSIFVSHY